MLEISSLEYIRPGDTGLRLQILCNNVRLIRIR
jgi:hypothetical protein